MNIESKIRTIPDFPKKGIMFRDITTLLKDHEAFDYVIEKFYQHYKNLHIDKVVSVESRGFIFGSVLAYKLGAGFVPIRKPGKLPAEVISQEYQLEYGKDSMEIHKDAIRPGKKSLCMTICSLPEGLSLRHVNSSISSREKLREYVS